MRPREFDHDEVLRIAFDQFWRKGVRGTSLADIARDAGVQRGSLYNAFGSKEALFLVAYERYAGDYLKSVQKALGAGTLRKRLTAFFDMTIRNLCAGSPPRGCPTTRGLMELGSAEGEGLDDERAPGVRGFDRAHHCAGSGRVVRRAPRAASSRETPERSAAHRYRDARPCRAGTRFWG